MDKVLWVKFGWSDYYRGGPVDGDNSYLKEEGNVGHEVYNFERASDDTYYCYVPPLFGSLAPSNCKNRGWTVVCLAKYPERTGIHIVGWYEDATLLGTWGNVPETRDHLPVSDTDSDARWSYCITSRTAYFVPPERRTMPFSHDSVRRGTFSFLCGPRVRTTASKKQIVNKNQVLDLLKRRMEDLELAVIENPTDETAPDLSAEPSDPLCGFGTPQHRKMVEKAAEKAVKCYYCEKDFLCTDVTKKNLGFDFIFKKEPVEYHVEVKGTSGDLPRFFMTRNENVCRKTPKWRFAIVTNVLGPEPTVRVYDNRQFKEAFELEPYVYAGTPIIPPEQIQ